MFCLIGALLRDFFTTKPHQISKYWTFILYMTPRTYESFLYPPQIHLEQEENLDKEIEMIDGSLLNKSSLKDLWYA